MFGLGLRSLKLGWHVEGAARGIVRVRVANPWPASAPTAVWVEVDGRRHGVECTQATPGSAFNLNLHTHLLENGSRSIRVGMAQGTRSRTSAVKRLTVSNEGDLAQRVTEALRNRAAPVAFLGHCDSGYYDYADETLAPWFDRPDASDRIARSLARGVVDVAEADLLQGFVSNGFMVLPDVLPEDLVKRANAALDHAISTRYQEYVYGESRRLELMHDVYPAIREIWRFPVVQRMLSLVFDQPSEPCQSLVYVFGSQQDAHQDTIHLTPYPAGYMCGVWAALEDVQIGSGELVVYPGSHRLPRVYLRDCDCPKVEGDWTRFGETVVKQWERLIAESGIQPHVYAAKRGSVLIWHENLMHAGSLRTDKALSRRSVVTHHFARGAIAYYDSTGNAGRTHPE